MYLSSIIFSKMVLKVYGLVPDLSIGTVKKKTNWIYPPLTGHRSIRLVGGYVWKFWDNMCLNPWIAGHLRTGGHTNIQIGDS